MLFLKDFFSCFSFFFPTIFSFQKLVCSFWQIARLQEFFINYKIGSHKHLDKLLLPPFVIVVVLFHHHLLPEWRTWMTRRMTGQMDGNDDHHRTDQGYYIRRYRYRHVGTRDVRTLWSTLVSLNRIYFEEAFCFKQLHVMNVAFCANPNHSIMGILTGSNFLFLG